MQSWIFIIYYISQGRVTLEEAKKLPKNYDEMPNDILLTMAVMGDQEVFIKNSYQR